MRAAVQGLFHAAAGLRDWAAAGLGPLLGRAVPPGLLRVDGVPSPASRDSRPRHSAEDVERLADIATNAALDPTLRVSAADQVASRTATLTASSPSCSHMPRSCPGCTSGSYTWSPCAFCATPRPSRHWFPPPPP